jgi:hypothetical protein
MKITKESLDITRFISDSIKNQTFHHHYHILFDIVNSYDKDYNVNYVEIGCYAGGSACLVLQRPNTNVLSVDLGRPIDHSVVLNNVKNLNKHLNKYTYVIGNSQVVNTRNEVIKVLPNIDVLFIDGDHSYQGVQNDFFMYNDLVNDGGYIIFDDYHDRQHSPEVRKSVDDLILKISDKYEIIGTFSNTFDARPSELREGNCFVLRKKHKETNVKIGIVIPTYQRNDGQTPTLLKRALMSIKSQTHQNYKVFLIGDHYENNDEFVDIATSILPENKIHYVNLPFAEERERYGDNKMALWSYGGVNANNVGVELALGGGYNNICHLDHDDLWESNHLSSLSDVIEQTSAPFVCTKSSYMVRGILPVVTTNEKFIEFYPGCAQLIHSSTCVNFMEIPHRYVDLFKQTGKVGGAADCLLWGEVNNWLKTNNKKGYMVNKLTCYHNEEGYSRKN